VSRITELEERRRALLAKCEEQRAELVYRLEQIRPSTQLANFTQRAPAMAMNHPLAWLAALAGIITLLRPKRLLSWLTFGTGFVSILSRATQLLKVFVALRSLRQGFR
jgi:hypothetical protein